MNRTALPLLLAAASLATGCFLLPGSELTEVLPDERIEINLPLASDLAKDDTREWSTFYLWTAEVTENVNRMTGFMLVLVDTITHDYRPSYVNEDQSEAVWGPWTEGPLDPNETQLRVQHDLETDLYTWGFERWAKDAGEEAMVTVVDGEVDPGATREVNSGRFTIDFTTINAMDPTEEATGIYAVDYDIAEDGVSGVASFEDFGPEGFDADYAYSQTFGGEGEMDLVLVIDLDPAWGLGLDETVAMHSRWLADGSGRGDVQVSGGDLGDEIGFATECWSSSFERVYYLDQYNGVEEGDPSLCAYPEAEYPAVAD
jgi:hypothetical protein